MADAAPATGGNPLKGRTLAGIPWWMWATGVVFAVGGYLYFRHVQNSAAANTSQSAASTGSGTAGPTGLTGTQFQQFLLDQQASPKSGWINVAGKKVYYSADRQTIGFKQGGKWVREAV